MFAKWLESFKPDEIHQSVADIDFGSLASRGLVNVILDVDNTIALRKSNEIDPKIGKILKVYCNSGIIQGTCLLSNITLPGNGRETRVEKMASDLGVGVECVCACLPDVKPRKTPYIEALDKIGATVENTVMVGDQLFTDIVGGKRLGLYTIWVKPMGSDHIVTYWKRVLEKMVEAQWKE